MSRIYVDVRTPGNGKTYEFAVESNMTVGQALARMADEITEFEDGNITIRAEDALLCVEDTEAVVRDRSLTLRAAGVRSGHRLILI